MSVSTNNSIRTLELVEEPHVDLPLPPFSPAWKRVEEHYGAACRFGRQAVEEAWRCGDALVAAKAETKHGDWLPALRVAGITPDTAQRFMRLRQTYAEIPQLAVFDSVFAALTSGKSPRAAAHDGNDEWYTPAGVVGAARAVMGRIDLDPASTSEANETVQAKAIYTVEDDGLTQPWRGRVFLNPPFSAQLKRAFCDRLRESVASGDVTQAVLVTPIDISPQWGDVIRTCASAVALAVGSTPFYGPRGEHGGPGFGHMVSYYGPNVERFASVFDQEWSVWGRVA